MGNRFHHQANTIKTHVQNVGTINTYHQCDAASVEEIIVRMISKIAAMGNTK